MRVPTPDLDERIRRARGRASRVHTATVKVTGQEREELEAAAKKAGQALSEWSREVLLREARGRRSELALFTEVVAVRMLLDELLPHAASGDKLTTQQVDAAMAEVRSAKHRNARTLLDEYNNPLGVGR